jgi:hypothetical protein
MTMTTGQEFLDARWAQLEKILLSHGGRSVCRVPEEGDLDELISRGQRFSLPVKECLGEPNNCHTNAAEIWGRDIEFLRLVTGYALGQDGVWHQHSWVIGNGKIYETTGRPSQYYGVVLNPERAATFWWSAFVRERYRGPLELLQTQFSPLATKPDAAAVPRQPEWSRTTTNENKAGNESRVIPSKKEFQEAIKALDDALTHAQIHAWLPDHEALSDDDEAGDPANGVRIELGCLDELDRLLRILTNPQAVSEPLYQRIVPSTHDAYPDDGWDYGLDPRTATLDHGPEPCSNGNLSYEVWVHFPATDLPEVLKILQKHNARPENRRQLPPATTEEKRTS